MKSGVRAALCMATALLFVVAGLTQSGKAAESSPMGKAFVQKVSQINLAEVELGKLAEQKGSNEAVKDFGKLMVSDHSKAEVATKALAAEEHIKLAPKPGADVQNLKATLSKKSGADFDTDYIRHMVAGHNGAVAMIEHEIEHDRNPKIRAFAEEILPTVQDHLRIAENVAGRLGMSGKGGLSQPEKAIPVAP